MSRFSYIARTEALETVKGRIEAESEQDVILKLAKLGAFPISLESEAKGKNKPGEILSYRIPRKEITLFSRQLSTLIESGINILDGLNIMLGQSKDKAFKEILGEIITSVKDGLALSDALSLYPLAFSPLYSAMIHSGEVGGTLNETLKRLADYLENEEEFVNSVRASLTYPFFVCAVGIATVIVILVFVIPRLVTMFEDLGQALPLPTEILINISGSIHSYWWMILLSSALIVFVVQRISHIREGELFLDKLKLRLPVLGDIVLKTEASRFCRVMSLLLSSSIPIVPALGLSEPTLGNRLLKEQVEEFKSKISQGASLSQCLKQSGAFTDFMANIVSVGEETGALDKALMRIADRYEQDAYRELKNISRMLEPVIILVMGLIVGFIVLAMLLPVFQLNLIVK